MIIGIVYLYNGFSNGYPFDFCIPTLDFVDRLLVFCGTKEDVEFAHKAKYNVTVDIIELGGDLFAWGQIAQRFNDGLQYIRKHYPTCEYIVKSDADLYLTNHVKAAVFKWLESPVHARWPFHIPIMRVVLYAYTYENYFGFVAFPNRQDFEFIKDGAYLNQGGYDPREPGRGLDSMALYGIELGQCRPIQLAKKDIRNQTMYAATRYSADLGRTYLKDKCLETFLNAQRERYEWEKEWERGNLLSCDRFLNSEEGKLFIEKYELHEEAQTVKQLIWKPLWEKLTP